MSEQSIKFEKYFKTQALEFFKENNLGIQTEYEHVSSDYFIVESLPFLRENKWNSKQAVNKKS